MQWVEPINIGPIATAVNSLGDIYVSGGYLEEFGPSGNLIWSDQNTRLDFQAICLGADGTLYATKKTSDSIYTFDSSGDLLSTVGVPHPTGSIVGFDDLTLSGNELAASALLANGSYTSGNELVLLSVPEPQPLWLLIAAFPAALLTRRSNIKK